MNRSSKKVSFYQIFIITALSLPAFAQAKLNLKLQPDGKTISVGIISEKTWAAPRNMVGSAQIVLRVPSNSGFVPGIVSKIDGVHWMDNFYIENPVADPGFTYICIALVENATTKISFHEGQETVLFEVKNMSGDCPGNVEILDNNDPRVQAVKAEGSNVTQNCAVLGAGKNAVSGIENGSINCGTSSNGNSNTFFAVNAVEVFPSPADQSVEVRWHSPENTSHNLILIISDAQGNEVEHHNVVSTVGNGKQILTVKTWVSGLYNCRFVSEDGRQSRAWNFVVLHP